MLHGREAVQHCTFIQPWLMQVLRAAADNA